MQLGDYSLVFLSRLMYVLQSRYDLQFCIYVQCIKFYNQCLHFDATPFPLGDSKQPTTMRQTNVIVIPSCDELSSFQTFDKLVQAINQARRASRDFVLKKKDDDDESKDWV